MSCTFAILGHHFSVLNLWPILLGPLSIISSNTISTLTKWKFYIFKMIPFPRHFFANNIHRTWPSFISHNLLSIYACLLWFRPYFWWFLLQIPKLIYQFLTLNTVGLPLFIMKCKYLHFNVRICFFFNAEFFILLVLNKT